MLQIGNNFYTHKEEMTHMALWAFARAPLLIGCDLETISQESLDILMNKELIFINQNGFGQQANCMEGCEFDPLNQYQMYQMLVNGDTGSVRMAVLIVNWDDKNEVASVEYDPIKLGVAFNPTDNCVYEDVYGEFETMNVDASPQTFTNIDPHFHMAFYVKCLPW